MEKHLITKRSTKDLAVWARRFVALGVMLAGVSGYLWFTELKNDDASAVAAWSVEDNERLFWSAIENSLAVPSVTRIVEDGGSGNSVVQRQQMFFGEDPKVYSQVSFDTRGALENTSVLTEGISYLDSQYSRYASFETDQPGPDGTSVSIDDLIGKWDHYVPPTEQEQQQLKEFYISEQATYVMFGNYSSDFRRSLVKNLRERGVYSFNNETVVGTELDGERLRVFTVNVRLKDFVEQVGSAFRHAGFDDSEQLDPEQITDPEEVRIVRVSVSERTGEVRVISVAQITQNYTGYGITKQFDRPDAEFSNGELETRIQEAFGVTL